MTIAQFALAETTPGQASTDEGGKKAPPKRTIMALADLRPSPERR